MTHSFRISSIAAAIAGAAVVFVVSSPATAAITLTTSNPLSTSLWQSDFETPTQSSPTMVTFVMDDGAGQQVTAVVTPVNFTEILYSCLNNNCTIQAWSFGIGNDGAARISFSPAVTSAAIRIDRCVGTMVGAIASGPNGTETFADTACVEDDWIVVEGAAGGSIEQLILRGNQVEFDDLHVSQGMLTQGADLAVRGAVTRGAEFATSGIELIVANDGPGPATTASLDVLVPGGVAISPEPIDGLMEVDLGDIADGTQVSNVFPVTAPEGFDCHKRITLVGLARWPGGEPNTANNVGSAHLVMDRSLIQPREVCGVVGDEDCDGSYGCADADCRDDPLCEIPVTLIDIDVGNLPWGMFPLLGPPFAIPADGPAVVPSPPGPMPNPNTPAPSSSCTVFVNGMARPAPGYCCQRPPRPGDPLWPAFQRDCPPRDPNAKDADPAVASTGLGFTAADQRIGYTVHYENVGATDAHDVTIIDVLSEELDDSTLDIQDGGVYDSATRTLTWVDPEVFPMDPREVHYSIFVRTDAPIGTRVTNTATIVFPDAVPPTRIDTNATVHVIPHPEARFEPDLFVSRCTREADGGWTVHMQNRGLDHAFNVSARAVSAPAGVQITGIATFAHETDPYPDEIATVMALFTTASRETVEIVGTDVDPCALVTWEITYQGLRDAEPTVVEVQALIVDEIIDDNAGCCSIRGGGVPASGTLVLLALVAFGLLGRRTRRAPIGRRHNDC